jgi:hypothetical protein
MTTKKTVAKIYVEYSNCPCSTTTLNEVVNKKKRGETNMPIRLHYFLLFYARNAVSMREDYPTMNCIIISI